MNKKLATLGLMTCLILSGCSSADGTTDNGVITLEYWHINSETFAGPTVTEIISRFNDSQDEIYVIEKFVPNNYQGVMQDLQAAVAAKTSPDLVQIGWSYKEYFSNNFSYTDAAQLFENYSDNPTFVAETFENSIRNLAVDENGNMVGFPYGLSVSIRSDDVIV